MNPEDSGTADDALETETTSTGSVVYADSADGGPLEAPSEDTEGTE